MKSTRIIASLLSILLIGLVYTSCKKSPISQPDNASAAQDNATADNAFAGIWKQIHKVANDSTSIKSAGYPIITISPGGSTFPKTVTIDFGTTNVLGNDGVNRRGVITAQFTGRYSDSATVITVTPNNYYHNDYKVDGVQAITNKGRNGQGNITFHVVVANAVITNPSGGTSTWATTQDREWIAGFLTPTDITDDAYLLRGVANGVAFNGQSYTILITSDLRVNESCPWIVTGIFTLTLKDYPLFPIIFNYGNGTCDANATAILSGTTYNVVMY